MHNIDNLFNIELKKKIVLITSSQLSLNPRLIKEADTLVDAGYEVEVIYQFWNIWGSDLDKQLIQQKKWKATRVGGDLVTEKLVYWKSRLVHKVAQRLIKVLGFRNNLAELAIGRCTSMLIEKARSLKADVYIAHNLSAIPAAVLASKQNKAKSGFDAEDLHRYETSDDDTNDGVRLKSYIEEKYFTKVQYLTASSPQIAQKYKEIFPSLNFTTLLNVFPKNKIKLVQVQQPPLKLFWFSQYVGLSRGIQDIIAALVNLQDESIEFHILGFLNQNVKDELDQFVDQLHFTRAPNLIFHEPIASDELVKFAENFDIGLATEPGFSINNDLALSNKIFTYIQAGLAVLASDTSAQKDLLVKYPGMGEQYERGNATNVSKILKTYIDQPELLTKHKSQSATYANEELNWERESEKLQAILKELLNTNGGC